MLKLPCGQFALSGESNNLLSGLASGRRKMDGPNETTKITTTDWSILIDVIH